MIASYHHNLSILRKMVPLISLVCGLLINMTADAADYTNAHVVHGPNASRHFQKAVQMLVEEIHHRTRVKLAIGHDPGQNLPEIHVLTEAQSAAFPAVLKTQPVANQAEGFAIYSLEKPSRIYVIGHDDRGVLFGLGRLLRELNLTRDRVELTQPLKIVSSPKTKIRGHQLGYRPKTNSYDAWDIDQWEQ